jgi:tetratricopeptide (TPR) repeat protein
MILPIVIAAGVAAAVPVNQSLDEAAHAIAAGRFDQARTMIGSAIAAGATGQPIERLQADLAFDSGHDAEALTRYQALLATSPADARLAERAGIAALKTGEIERAEVLIDRATRSPIASWRAWNARGVLADNRRDWAAADAAYAEAGKRAPEQARVFNNIGWSKLLRGDWPGALIPLLRAAELDPHSARIADNLELAQTAVAEDLPRRQAGESDRDWAARLNDAGVVARLRGDKARAIAAFSRAIEASDVWYERAANNLRLAQSAP